MLFQSDYWFTTNEHERVEMLRNFLITDEGITDLIIIGDYLEAIQACEQAICEEDEDIECHVKILAEKNVERYGKSHHPNEINFYGENATHTKTIHVCRELGKETMLLIKTLSCILAINA